MCARLRAHHKSNATYLRTNKNLIFFIRKSNENYIDIPKWVWQEMKVIVKREKSLGQYPYKESIKNSYEKMH